MIEYSSGPSVEKGYFRITTQLWYTYTTDCPDVRVFQALVQQHVHDTIARVQVAKNTPTIFLQKLDKLTMAK